MAIEISMYVVWSIVAIIAFVVELHTLAQVGFSACISAVGALVAHAITKGEPIWIELLVFFIMWVILWIALFLFFRNKRKGLHDKEDGYLAYIGKTVKAIKGNEDEYGELKFSGKVFRFSSKDKIKIGDQITIEKIEGVTFFVKKVK